MEVFQASLENLDEVSKLFDRYRSFYNQPSSIEAAKAFLQERFQKGESTVFVADLDDRLVGFTQLYPSFSSVSMKPIWVLNDLFVEEPYRQRGIAKFLMKTAEKFARETGAVRIILSTQMTNHTAQFLYESLGYHRDETFYHYGLEL